MLCVTGVYLRNIANMTFVILHLNVSCLSVSSSCLAANLLPIMKQFIFHSLTECHSPTNTCKVSMFFFFVLVNKSLIFS